MKEKNIVIFGASSGLGEALTLQSHEAGAQVFAVSRTVEHAVLPNAVHRIACDVTIPQEVIETFAQIYEEIDIVHLVITTVGKGLLKLFSETTDEEIQQIYDTNLLGPTYIAREALSRMIPQGEGHIMTVSSTTGLEGKPNEVVYSAAKQGIRGMHQALSKEASPYGIEATCLFVGGMLADGNNPESFWNQTDSEKDISKFMPTSVVAKKIMAMLRTGSPYPQEFVIKRES